MQFAEFEFFADIAGDAVPIVFGIGRFLAKRVLSLIEVGSIVVELPTGERIYARRQVPWTGGGYSIYILAGARRAYLPKAISASLPGTSRGLGRAGMSRL